MPTPQELLQMARQAGVKFPDLPPALQEAVASGRMDEATARQRALQNRPQYRQAMGLPAAPEDAAVQAAGGSGAPAQARPWAGSGEPFQPSDAQRMGNGGPAAPRGANMDRPGAGAQRAWEPPMNIDHQDPRTQEFVRRAEARYQGTPPGSSSSGGPAGEGNGGFYPSDPARVGTGAPGPFGASGSPGFVRMGVPQALPGASADGAVPWNSGGLPGGDKPAGPLIADTAPMNRKLPTDPMPGAPGPAGAGAKPQLSDLATLAGGPPRASMNGGGLQAGPAGAGPAENKPKLADLASVGAGGFQADPAAENRRRLMEQRKAASGALGI